MSKYLASLMYKSSVKLMDQWQGLGLAIGALMMDVKKATTLASVTVMTFMLAGGFFVKVSNEEKCIFIFLNEKPGLNQFTRNLVLPQNHSKHFDLEKCPTQ